MRFFFQLIYRKREQGFKKQMLFIATFTTRNNGTKEECIDWSQCRVVTPECPEMAWRGDRIASELNTELQDMFGAIDGSDYKNTFYDLMTRANQK